MKKVSLLLLVMSLPLFSNPLERYQWKNRLLLLSLTEDEEEKAQVTQLLSSKKAELSERDLVVINLSAGKWQLPLQKVLSEAEKAELRKRLQVAKSKGSTFILLGKDGSEKARQRGRLELRAVFALIDAMPMRKAELRQRGQ